MLRKQEYCEKKNIWHIAKQKLANTILQVSISHAFEMFDFTIKATADVDILLTHIYDSIETHDTHRSSRHHKHGNTGLGSSVGRVSAPRSGGTGFDPGPRHTKVVNNGTSCSPLGTRIFGVGLGLVAPVSV